MKVARLDEFDPVTCPLEGMNLIEASAGTGKTHTIGSLFLRLLLEGRLDIGQILVVTFTQAATEELKERIRARVKEALEVFLGNKEGDDFLEGLQKRIVSRSAAQITLENSLRRFDEAAIYTIHGFCARVLEDHAFEMGQPFDTTIITQEDHLYEKLAFDFWRNHLYNAPPEFVSLALAGKFAPDLLAKLLAETVKWPDLTIVPQDQMAEMPELGPLRDKFMEIKQSWVQWEPEIRTLLLSPSLSGIKYKSLNKGQDGLSGRELFISLICGQMSRWISRPWPLLPLFPHFEKFTAQYLLESTRKGMSVPRHEFFELAQTFYGLAMVVQDQMDAHLLSLKVKFLNLAREELEREKSRSNVKGYQDLITKTAEVLKGSGSNKVIAAIRKRYKAALIDEFHDTDSAQYSIFTSLFGHGSRPLFLVGDPKQAIYAFRGADIFAYLRATSEVNRTYTLRTNWRSHPSLINAINTFFQLKQRPFLFDQIGYVDTRPAGKKKVRTLKIQGRQPPPLIMWYLDRDPETRRPGPVSKARAREILAKSVACEISRLIGLGRQGRAFLDEQPVTEKDIAVLVRTNREAFLVQDTLRSFNIHSVLYTGEDVFLSPEAWEMEQIVAAIASPEDAQLVKGALATRVFGLDALDLMALEQDTYRWEEIILRFREYRKVWEKSGFMAMFYRLLYMEKAFSKLLASGEGERKISNFLQISECMHKAALEQSLGIHATVVWLARQRDPEVPRSQEHQLRLESDEDAVTVLTIHKSKGLEFPIVFCPYAWSGVGSENRTGIRVHLPNKGGQFVYDLGSSEIEKNRAIAAKEELAENIRLLYVALTRAKSACYVAWGDINQTETSAFAYLLCGPDDFCDDDVINETSRVYTQAGKEGIGERLRDLERLSNGSIQISEPPFEGEAIVPLRSDPMGFSARQFKGHIAKDWGVSSFSSLVSGQQLGTDLPDYDLVTRQVEATSVNFTTGSVKEELSILDFPKGAKAGTVLHKIMEDLDFTEHVKEKSVEVIKKRLNEYGYELIWTDAIYRMFVDVVNAPMESLDQGPRLKEVPISRRLNELEFYFPLRRISPGSLADLFQQLMPSMNVSSIHETIRSLGFSQVKGFMKGFIDMIFEWEGRYYLVDWKSNFLGPSIDYYRQENLEQEMVGNLYILQYHIYTLALDQFLRLRLNNYSYERYFGAVYYVFLRGVDPGLSPEYGIYRARPTEQMMERLRRGLLDDGSVKYKAYPIRDTA